jgi:filamentous hemagglutinin
VNSLILGADFGQGLLNGLRTGFAANVLQPGMMFEVGELGAGRIDPSITFEDGSLVRALLHAGTGALGGLIMGDLRGALGGALGAGLSELVVPAVAASFDLNNASDAPTLRGLSQILGGLGSLVVQDGSLAGAISALNGFDFNGSLHPRLVRPGTPMGLLASLFPWIVQQTPGVGDNGGPPLTPDDLGQGPDPSRPPPIDPRNAGAALTAAAMGYAIYTGRTTSDGRPIFSDGNGSFVAVDPVTTAGSNSAVAVTGSGDAIPVSTPAFPANPSQIEHIFRNDPGHISDTPENRQLLVETASDPRNFQGINSFQTQTFTRSQADGSQIWVQVRNGVIQNGGINDAPRPWDPILRRLR